MLMLESSLDELVCFSPVSAFFSLILVVGGWSRLAVACIKGNLTVSVYQLATVFCERCLGIDSNLKVTGEKEKKENG